MKTHFAALALAAAVLLPLRVVSAGQPAQASPILNELEWRQALGGTGGADHARLEAHFAALADRYAGEATRHESMARRYPAGSHKGIGPDLRAHCNNLVRLNRRLDASARSLAKIHATAAPGQAQPTPPQGLSSNLGVRQASEDELTAFAEKAAAAGDHQGLAEYWLKLAERYDTDASVHQGMATLYRTGRTAGAADHCERLAQTARAAAKEAKAASGQHAAGKPQR